MSESIDEIERIVGNRLPDDLRSYFSGDFPEIVTPAEIDVPDTTPWIDEVEQLYDADDALSLLQDDIRSLEYEIREIPVRTVPIGDNGNGDFFVVSLRESDFGTILYMFHETSDPMDDSLEGAFVLATKLSRWIESFRPAKDRSSIPDWDAIRDAKLEGILHPKPPWRRFWAKSSP